MFKKIFISVLYLCVFCSSAALATDKPPVLVELFTSEFCPACPPADQYLAKLSQEDNMIALGCHVTYFKSRSELGRPLCSQRQFDYMRSLKGKSPYTPQFVINGHKSVVGTQPSKVAAALLQAQSAKTQYIKIYPKAHGVFGYSLPDLPENQYEISLALYQKEQMIRSRNYTNAVDIVLDIGGMGWQGRFKSIFPSC